MKIIDAHIHLWDIDRLDYPWLANVPAINRTYLLSDYEKARGGTAVKAVVFVQCECRPDQYRDELAWVQSLADRDPRLKAIVPWAPLEDGEAVAEALRAIAADPRVKGVRRIIEFEENIDFCIQPGFVRGVQLLGEVGLHCELTIGPRNFPNVMKLIEASPGTKFILDHIGSPNIAEGRLQPWKDDLRAFAASGPHPCKFSNLVCNADLENWTIEDLRPFADAVIEIFGPDRIIWASDWPHALRASSWQRWFETARELTAGLGGDSQQKIFHDNAARFYRL
ncbi:MAG: amidohydrolase family protein [Verrucomicrobia bacterium]|nr:amidohydrolase family protein [Verrucomicrobiota bacterium]